MNKGIVFHYIHKEKPFQGSIPIERFEGIVNKNLGYLLPADIWLNNLESNTLEEEMMCITFDDGLKCQYELAYPILRKYDLTAFFFINTCNFTDEPCNLDIFKYFMNRYFNSMDDFYIEFYNHIKKTKSYKMPNDYLHQFPFLSEEDKRFRYYRDVILSPSEYAEILYEMMFLEDFSYKDIGNGLWINEDELRKLFIDGNIIGLHTHSHPTNLRRLPNHIKEEEYVKNISMLTEITSQKPISVAHPNNSYDEYILKLLRKLGIRIGFRSDMSSHHKSLLELPRIDAILLEK